jgi:pimeloyl-ACP methyl ester carboxylesterase
MTTFVFIHGAGGSAWDWSLVEPELRARGHDTIAMDLPCDDDTAGLAEYTDAVVAAIGDRRDDLVLVAQSIAGFTAPLVCERVPVRLMVLVAGMIPNPGELCGDWWANVGHAAAREADGTPGDDLVALFLNGVPPEVVAESEQHLREQSGRIFEEACTIDAWPDVPTRFVLGTEDHFFPPEWLRGIVRDRLGIEPDELPSCHVPALSHPKELAALLDRYAAELD